MPPRHPPHGPHGPPHKHGRHVPGSRVAGFIDVARLDRVLAPLVPEADDRAFLLRCMVDEGPAHHRGANYVLLALLGEVLARLGAPTRGPAGPTAPVPMRLPPHLEDEVEDGDYPIALPLEPLEMLAARPRDVEAMVDCLTDGPPQHAVANVIMVALIERLLAASSTRDR